jgi:hypothetical protein
MHFVPRKAAVKGVMPLDRSKRRARSPTLALFSSSTTDSASAELLEIGVPWSLSVKGDFVRKI